MIQIGNQTAAWATSPTEPFEYALANGFDAFEWFPDKKPGAGWDESDLDGPQRAAIRKAANECRTRLSVHAPWQANPLRPDSAPLLAKDVELAQDIGAALLNIHLCEEAGLDAYIRAITPLIELTAKAQLQLSIENTPSHSPEQFNDLFRGLGKLTDSASSHVGMCLDLGHANLCSATRNDYLRFIDRLDPAVPIIHLHLHENWGDADTHLTLFTGPSGRDDSGIRAFLERIQKRAFSGSIVLEQWPKPHSLLNNARDRLLSLLNEQKATALRTAQPLTKLRRVPSEAQGAKEHSPAGKPKSSPKSTPQYAPGSSPTDTLAANDGFAAALIATDKRSHSWREKLDSIRVLLAEAKAPLATEQLIDTAIYLRFLSTGQIQCAEDGRHFRPGHHASIALDIYERLTSTAATETTCVIRKILPWLPSTAKSFRRAEPLTRIRDIAHRNDIPAELKRELKHSLQNKLHRCAGPEDLATSAAFLKRFTDPGTNYPPAFVEEFKLFHNELKEFFNASSLEDRLKTLLPKTPSEQADLITSFLQQKAADDLPDQLTALGTLTELRSSFLETLQKNPGPDSQEFLLTDISLEEFAFALLSAALNTLDSDFGNASQPDWSPALRIFSLVLANLALSGVGPEECRALGSELQAWSEHFNPREQDQMLRLKATIERSRRLAESFSERILTLFPRRAEVLGRRLRIPEPAIRVFAEAEVRSHLVFQLSKLVSLVLRRIRQQLSLPPWDVLVSGQANGRLTAAESLDQFNQNSSEPIIALVKKAEGDEEIPKAVAGVVLGHELPHLSHLGVRARQAKIVFVATNEPSIFANLGESNGQSIALSATPDKVEWTLAPTAKVANQSTHHEPVRIPGVYLKPDRAWLTMDQVTSENAGGKAYGVRQLVECSQQPNSGFRVPEGLAIPFGVMEGSLESVPELKKRYRDLVSGFDATSEQEVAEAAKSLHELLHSLTVPDEIPSVIAEEFGQDVRLIVRSSANCEDLEKLAGAGLYESVANVAPSNIAAAVRTVWSSLWSRRAAMSRQHAGIPHNQAHMAVLIQKMLTPDYSFILHTVNPVRHSSSEVYAELAVGLGETLASAADPGTPYRLICDKISCAVTTLAFANFSQALFPAASDLERRIIDYSAISLSKDAKSREAIGRQFAQLGRFIEDAFGQPQDIEGAVVGDQIYLVQSRPQQGIRQVGVPPLGDQNRNR